MRLYSRALSAAEVAALADDGLYAYWPFDETSGTTAADASGNGRTGTLGSNATTVTLPSWLPSGWINGCIGMPVDNGGRYVSAPGVTWKPVDFTVSFWMNPYQLAGGQWGQVITATGNFWGKFTFMLFSDGSIQVGTNGPLIIPASTVEANKWQLYTFTFDGDATSGKGEGRFYENGQLLASRADMAVSQTWAGFSIGIADPRGRLHSRIDEMRLYSRALSAAEVAALFTGPLTATWRPDAPTTEWSKAANWVEGAVPLKTTDVTVNTCTNCPNLAASTGVKSIAINGGQLSLNAFTLSATGGVRLQEAKLMSSEGALQAADFLEVKSCIVEGNLLLRKTGNVNNAWFGNNTFRGKLTIVNQGTGSITPATQANDTVTKL